MIQAAGPSRREVLGLARDKFHDVGACELEVQARAGDAQAIQEGRRVGVADGDRECLDVLRVVEERRGDLMGAYSEIDGLLGQALNYWSAHADKDSGG